MVENKRDQNERANEQPNTGRREGREAEGRKEDVDAKDVAQAMADSDDTEETKE